MRNYFRASIVCAMAMYLVLPFLIACAGHTPSGSPPPATQPDLNGVWSAPFTPDISKTLGHQPPFTPYAAERFKKEDEVDDPLTQCLPIGPARGIDARGPGPLCRFEEIESALDGAPQRLLFRLMEGGDHFTWPAGFRALAPETVKRLARAGTRLIGVDVPSVDPESSKELPSHMACRRHDIRIIENLVLAGVMPGDYELIALPLRLKGLDAAPVRAVLRRLNAR